MKVTNAGRWAVGLAAAATLAAGCDEYDGVTADGGTQKPALTIVGGGAEVTALTWAPAGQPPATTSTEGIPAIDRKGAFPLMAYRELCGDVRPSDMGLAAPRLRVAVGGPGGASHEVAFGAPNFNGAGIYTSVAGSRCVYLVTASSVRRIAALAGEEAAAAFQPPVPEGYTSQDPGPEGETTEEKKVDHPWVAQAKRHLARGSGGPPSLEGERDHAS